MAHLFSTLYGSSLYGTNTPTSDRDIKRIVLPSLRDAILGKVPKNKVKKTNKEEYTKNSADDVDEEFIPLQIFAKDFMEGQTYALELAFAVDYTNAEQVVHNELFTSFCHDLRSRFMTSSMRPMIQYAVNQATLYSNKGERLNAAVATRNKLIAIADWKGGPGSRYNDKLSRWWDVIVEEFTPLAKEYPTCIEITEYQINPEGDMRPCIKVLERILSSTANFNINIATISSVIKKYGARAKAAQADQVDWKATSHALRIINEGITLLSGLPLVYPYPKEYCEYLLSIKRGEINHEVVMKAINDGMDNLKDIQSKSTLPPNTPQLQSDLQDWLFEWLVTFYEDINGLTYAYESEN